MSHNTILSEIDSTNPRYLIVSAGAQELSVVPLPVGVSVFVGSGADCRIQLPDESLQQIQCVLLLKEDNVLTIRDQNTGTTFLNDHCVSDEAQVRSGDVVTIGQCRLTPVLDVEFHDGFAIELLSESGVYSADGVVGKTDWEVDSLDETDSAFSFDAGDGLTRKRPKRAETGFKYDFDADLKEDSVEDNRLALKPPAGGGSSMSAEIELLRFEIADRDAQILALKQQVAGADQSSTVDESDTLKLVSRLEELLEELKLSDERVQGLEELLRVSEHATMAEREERLQINTWLNEIEKRIGQREAELEAEIDSLTRQVQNAKQDADVIQTQFESMSVVSSGSEEKNDALAALNEQVEELRASLQEANEKNRELVRRAVVSEQNIDFRTKMHEAQDELAKFRLEASKERAEMARRHAELESIRDELEIRANKPARNFDESVTRMRALREHLKDIHAEEMAAKAKEKSNSLGGRIASLLTRLR